MESSQAQKLLKQLRDDYVNELPSQCDEIENIILSLAGSFREQYEELYRRVHSMKGSAGVHGLMIVTSICHNFEERLNVLEMAGGDVAKSDIDLFLRHVDLVRSAQAIAANEGSDFSQIEEELQQLRKQGLQDQFPVMLVEASGYVKLLCQESLRELPVQFTVESDGLAALSLLLKNKYSLLITAREVETLNGLALINAVRTSDCINKHIPVVMLTSSHSLPANQAIKPDYIVSRNTELADSLPKIVQEIVAGKL